MGKDMPDLNGLVLPIVDSLCDESASLGTVVSRMPCGARVIDAGVQAPGGLECGRRIAEICMGGLGKVSLGFGSGIEQWPWQVSVSCRLPVLSCLGNQYGGWSLSGKKSNGKQWFGNASGPARLLGSKEALLRELKFAGQVAAPPVLVIEADSLPPDELAKGIAEKCGISPGKLTLVITPTASVAGGVQIVARVLETALHKAHALGFKLADIVDGQGMAPLSPPGGGFLTAMGRSNDAILFAGQVHLYVRGKDTKARELAQKLPSSSSADYGIPFADIFRKYDCDFYRIDPLLFSPALVAVSTVDSGNTYHSGAIDKDLLLRSFAGAYAFS